MIASYAPFTANEADDLQRMSEGPSNQSTIVNPLAFVVPQWQNKQSNSRKVHARTLLGAIRFCRIVLHSMHISNRKHD